MSIDDLLATSSVVLVVGSGGVGKTTNAAALAIRAAQTGRRTVVVTVDPARRLADALGLVSGLSATPQRIDLDVEGELWALMLDPRTTFDRLIERESTHPDLTERIRSNRIYQNLAGGLSGTQEYLATEELYSLHQDDRFDLVVVDTPPSRHVLDIVDAPLRLVTLFDNRLYQLLTGKTSGPVRFISRAAQRFAKIVAGVVGAEVVEDAIEFFTIFESLEGGFQQRAVAVTKLLTSPQASIVLVAGPKPDVVATGVDLVDALTHRSMPPAGLIINLIHPDLMSLQGGDVELDPSADDALSRLLRRRAHERGAVEPLLTAIGEVPVVEVPLLAEDIHDQAGLSHVVARLATTS